MSAMVVNCDIKTVLTCLGAFLVLIGILIYAYFRYSFTYWKRHGVAYLSPSFPFGNLSGTMLMRRQMGLVFKDIYDALPGHKVVGFYQMHQPVLMIRDVNLVKEVLVKDFEHFHDRGIYSDQDADPLMHHLFLMNGKRWKTVRSALTPTFTSVKIKSMMSVVEVYAETLRVSLKGQLGVVDVSDLLARFTTDVIASCAFGIQSNCLVDPDAEFRRMGREFFDRGLVANLGLVCIFLAPSIARLFRTGRTPKHVAEFFFRIVRETVDYREKNNVLRDDFMKLLIQLKNGTTLDGNTDASSGGKKLLTFNEIAAQAFIMYLAGFETTSTTLSYCLYELAVQPDIQTRVRKEMHTVLRRYGGKLEYEALNDLIYLEMVLTETMRKHPAIPQLNRVCTKKYQVPGSSLVVEPNTLVVVPVYAIQNDPQHYPNPERFDPERFSPEVKDKQTSFSYLPFGEGPHICIGKRFAMMVMKILVVSLISDYEFTVSEKTAVPLQVSPQSILLTAAGGIHLRVLEIEDIDNKTSATIPLTQ